MNAYKCNACGAIAEGKWEDLYKKGWRCRSFKKGGRVKRMCGCPMHAELVERDGR